MRALNRSVLTVLALSGICWYEVQFEMFARLLNWSSESSSPPGLPWAKLASDIPILARNQTEFCAFWNVDSDDWWTHQPEWEISLQDEEGYCFRLIRNRNKRAFLRQMYANNFHNDCSNVVTKHMWSSGWGADLSNVIDAYLYGFDNKRPSAILTQTFWHFAQAKPSDDNPNPKPTCATKDMGCYFLPVGNCPPGNVSTEPYLLDWYSFDSKREAVFIRNMWTLDYILRQQTWLRRKVYEFRHKQSVASPCAVLHVRRSDIVFHGQWSRKYHPMEEYVENLTIPLHKNILLLTDDHNAIGEAHHKYPDYNWSFIDRPRYKGAEGGWEKHAPSGDAAFETITLLTIFELVKQCSQIVRTSSNLGSYLYAVMRQHYEEHGLGKVQHVNLDAHRNPFSANNTASQVISKDYALKNGKR